MLYTNFFSLYVWSINTYDTRNCIQFILRDQKRNAKNYEKFKLRKFKLNIFYSI